MDSCGQIHQIFSLHTLNTPLLYLNPNPVFYQKHFQAPWDALFYIVFDQDKIFTSKFWGEIFKQWVVDLASSIAYHP